MKSIILAAGEGKRLRPLTNDIPKCMVEVDGTPLIEHQINCLKRNGIKEINICLGYSSESVNFEGVNNFYNHDYYKTNMVYTLFCAESELVEEDIIISYGDINYNDEVLKKLIDNDSKIAVVSDRNWQEYWKDRMENPLDDAETFKLNPDGSILELGKKPRSYKDIEGQYIGLFKLRSDIVLSIKEFYHKLDRSLLYDGKDFNNMYMTTFLYLISKEVSPLTPVFINNGWIEIDEPSDLKHLQYLKNKNN
tara:strand:- start:28363 stop:29112 length:750 start_codon:yes stop_codon:yes gene_type:complete